MEPDCAELLLLAGKHSPLFARIRYVIFDEVHNIVSKEGSVWEHLLTFINAPFVALSATVGNPEDFMSWLQRLETVRGHHRSTQIFMNMFFFVLSAHPAPVAYACVGVLIVVFDPVFPAAGPWPRDGPCAAVHRCQAALQ
jgi:hypothetical protein